MHIVDRRLNPRGKSLENRQRFLRRMKGAVQQAVKRSLQNRNIRDVLDGGEISLPIDGMAEPNLRRGDGGIRDHILLETGPSSKATFFRARRGAGAVNPRMRAKATARTASVLC